MTVTSEASASPFQFAALTEIMQGSCMLQVFLGDDKGLAGGIPLASAKGLLSLHMTIIKLLRLEQLKGQLVEQMASRDRSVIFPAPFETRAHHVHARDTLHLGRSDGGGCRHAGGTR